MKMKPDIPLSPVRKIGMMNRSVSGVVPSLGHYESALERDFMEMLRFDPAISVFTPQPLTINYFDKNGRKGIYTPDGFISFIPEVQKIPILYEVKYRKDFRLDWKLLMPKFRAAKAYCEKKGWRFEVFTEREIRTTYLENIRFLWPYLERVPTDGMKRHVLTILSDLGDADPDFLLCALCHDRANRARMIPVIWHLIATGAIGCNLEEKLTMNSYIWPQMGCQDEND